MDARNSRIADTVTLCRADASATRDAVSQIELLRSYADASTKRMRGRLISAAADRVGDAPLWEDFGGRSCRCHKLIWSSRDDYGRSIITM
jgi:hypothetical protein